jgi:hypothetical protein
MSEPVPIHEQLLIASNRHGYTFAVGRVDDRWLGYAIGLMKDGSKMLFVLPGVGDGPELGVTDRAEAIRRTSAIALTDPSYGWVETWHVPEDLRGDPEQYRCAECGEVCCGEDHTQDAMEDW